MGLDAARKRLAFDKERNVLHRQAARALHDEAAPQDDRDVADRFRAGDDPIALADLLRLADGRQAEQHDARQRRIPAEARLTCAGFMTSPGKPASHVHRLSTRPGSANILQESVAGQL